ncbi:MAG: beta-lactamase family protein [Chloroflexaceae bacterium]|jgi:CubicO group peptidase (beta-lactamase class C family)|nr:beta-lactamase family protein [Chloroflexaceae bacterium]
MRFVWPVSLIVLCCTLLLAVAPLHAAPSAQPADFEAIERYVEEQRQVAHIPGLALVVVRDNQIVQAQGFGVAGSDNNPVTPQTAFGIGSISKSFTALAIMQLVEAGKLELDAPVQRYLPFFRTRDGEASARITVRHLLHQTSGLPTAAGFWEGGQPGENPLEARVRALAEVELAHAPGTAFLYCNANYDTLGLLVQVASGQPYAAYMREQIFAPLGMAQSFVLSAESAGDAARAVGHQDWFGLPQPRSGPLLSDGMAPGGAIITTADDMGRYLIAQLNGGRFGAASVLSPEGMATLQQPSGVGDAGYAMGWSERTFADATGLLHNGGSPNFTATALFLPQERMGVAVLANVNALGMPLPQATRSIAASVATMLLNGVPEEPRLAGVRTERYLKWLLLFSLVWPTLTMPLDLRRWLRKVGNQPGRKPLAQALFFDLLGIPIIAALLLFWSPIPFWALLRFYPDIGWLLVAVVATALLKAGLRLWLVGRSKGQTVPIASSTPLT